MSRDFLRSLFLIAEAVVAAGIILAPLNAWREVATGSGMALAWIFLVAFLALPFLSVSLQRTDRWLSLLGVGTFLLGLVMVAIPR